MNLTISQKMGISKSLQTNLLFESEITITILVNYYWAFTIYQGVLSNLYVGNLLLLEIYVEYISIIFDLQIRKKKW